MKIAVAIDKEGLVSRHPETCRGFLIFQDVGGDPSMHAARMNVAGGLAFGPATCQFPNLAPGVQAYLGVGMTSSLRSMVADCEGMICRQADSPARRRLQIQGVRLLSTDETDPEKAVRVVWETIRNRAA